jgi:hypothetical protein
MAPLCVASHLDGVRDAHPACPPHDRAIALPMPLHRCGHSVGNHRRLSCRVPVLAAPRICFMTAAKSAVVSVSLYEKPRSLATGHSPVAH